MAQGHEIMGTTFETYEPIICSERSHKIKLNQVDWKESVVVRSPNWLGDALMTLPALYQLRCLMSKQATFDIVCPEKVAAFWQCVPWVDNIITIPSRRLNKDKRERMISPLGAGVAVVLPNSFGSAKDLYLKNIPVRVGRRGNLRRSLLTHTLPPFVRKKGQDTHHQATEYFDIISAFGHIDRSIKYPPLEVGTLFDTSMAFEVQSFLDENTADCPILLISPGAAFGPAKQWPISHFAEVAKAWSDDGGVVLVVGTDADLFASDVIVEECKFGYNLAGKTDLKELIAIMQMSDLCLCNDSGGMHLAAACGLSGVGIFGSTSPIATGPLSSSKWVIAQSDLACSPCLERQCPLDKPEDKYRCLREIRPEDVYSQLSTLFDN